MIDSLNKLTLFIGDNRLHNRIYKVDSNQEKNITENPVNHKKTFVGANGEEKIVCSEFTGNKEILVTTALDLALQLQLLEQLKPKENGLCLVRELN